MNDRQKNTEMDLLLALGSLGYDWDYKEGGILFYTVTWGGEYLWYDYESRVLSMRLEDGDEVMKLVDMNTVCATYQEIKEMVEYYYGGY